jgi:hypothetical protein
MDLNQFFFPVEIRDTYYSGKEYGFYKSHFKTIVDGRDNKAISIVKPTYKLISNEELVTKALETLAKTDVRYEVDNTHSFCQPNRMKLKLNLPDYVIKDDTDNGIALSLHIHNSYDMSEGARLLFGAIRWICTNGSVFGKVLGKWYSKHTQGFSIDTLAKYMDGIYKQIPEINQRIEVLQNLEGMEVVNNLLKTIKEKLGTGIVEHAETEFLLHPQQGMNAWVLYNILTQYISHNIQQRQRARYEAEVSKIFEL